MALSIRDARPGDEGSIIGFLCGIQEAERAMHPSRLPASDVVPGYYLRLVERHADILIAEDGGQVVGFTAGWLDVDDDVMQTAEWRAHGWVSDLYVIEGHRGRGISQLLLQAIADRLKGKGAHRLRICAIAPNEAAIAAYRRFGFSAFEVTFDKSLA